MTTINAKTRSQFKPRNATKGTTSYQLRQFAEATLGSGSLRTAVKLPEGEDLNEWLAVNGLSTQYMLSGGSHVVFNHKTETPG
jgi:MOB kinase activator 1